MDFRVHYQIPFPEKSKLARLIAYLLLAWEYYTTFWGGIAKDPWPCGSRFGRNSCDLLSSHNVVSGHTPSDNNWLLSERLSDNNFLDTVGKS